MKKLSIIVPVYNEEKSVLTILRLLASLPLGVEKEIIIVDDGSTDRSKEIIKNYIKNKKKNPKTRFVFLSKLNGGKGSALRLGFEHASGDACIIQDADLEYQPKEILLLIDALERGEGDVIYGSRILEQKNPYVYLTYYLGNRFLSIITSILYGTRITDMETCYKLIPTPILRTLYLQANSFDIEPEITAQLLRKEHHIHEIPITYNPRSKQEGKKIRWKDGFEALWTLFLWRVRPLSSKEQLNPREVQRKQLRKLRKTA